MDETITDPLLSDPGELDDETLAAIKEAAEGPYVEVHRPVASSALIVRLVAEIERLRLLVALFEGRCSQCGSLMEGEWHDGTYLTCFACGAEVVAEEMSCGGWSFPLADDDQEQDDDEKGTARPRDLS